MKIKNLAILIGLGLSFGISALIALPAQTVGAVDPDTTSNNSQSKNNNTTDDAGSESGNSSSGGGSGAQGGVKEALNGASQVKTGGAKSSSLPSVIETVTNILLFIVGAVSVIMIVVGGIKYVISNGDSNSVQSAKNTILYAVIGLIVAIVAYALVKFVIEQFVK